MIVQCIAFTEYGVIEVVQPTSKGRATEFYKYRLDLSA